MNAAPQNEDAVQLQTAMHQIDALHHALTQSITGFGTLFADHGQQHAAEVAGAGGGAAGGAQAGELHDVVTQLHEIGTQLGTELSQTLDHAIDGLHQTAAHALTAVTQHLHDWDQAHDALKNVLTSLEQTAAQTAASAVSTLGELQTSVEHVAQSTQDLLHQFEGAAQTLATGLTGTVTSTLSKASGEFHDGIASTLNGQVTQHLSSAFQNTEQALTNLGHTAEHVAQQFAHEATDALGNFAHTVVEGVKNDLLQTGEHLAKDAVEALGALVAASIAEATAGAAITGAMSPILPEVIVVKEATEVIKDLISVFKTVGSIL